jgi:tRNA threonylcarbamoyladenosine biosynthesis protein TsaB
VDTLESLAHQVEVESGSIIPLLDARRMEVYSAVYDNKHQKIRAIEAEIISETSFSDYLKTSNVYFIGDGVEKIKTVIHHPNAIFIDGKLPSAKNMSILAFDKYKKSDFEDVAYFEPFYLKDFIGLKS